MALGPGGERWQDQSASDLAEEDALFAGSLESIIDRALQRHPRGDTFVYGIHQEISPAAAEFLRSRYQAAGWSEVTLKTGATGALLLILVP